MKASFYHVPALALICLMCSCSSVRSLRDRDFNHVLTQLKLPEPKTPVILSGPLTLSAAKQIGLRQNPDVKSAIYRTEQALARLKQAKSAYYPSLGVGAGYTHTEWQPSLNNPFAQQGQSQTYRASIGTSWLLFDGLRRKFTELSAEYTAEASKAAIQDMRRLLCKGISQAYLSLLLQQEFLRIAEADRDFNKRLLEDTKLKAVNYMASRPDVLNFQVRYNESQINVIGARRDYSLARVVLAELLGLSNAQLPDNLTLELPDGPEENAVFLEDQQIERALLRPDLQVMARQVAAAEANVEAARGALYPTLTLTGEYGYLRENDPRFGSDDRSGGGSISADWDFDLRGAKRAALSEAKSAFKEAGEVLQSRYNAVCSEIRQEVQRLTAAQKEVVLFEENIKLSKALRDAETLRWKEGEVSITRLNEVQTNLIRTEASAAVAQIQLRLSYENLKAGTNDNVPLAGK